MEQAENGDIESLDTEVITEQENYMEETMEEMLGGNPDEQLSESETPGEAVFTSSASLDVSSGAKLLKEQTRAKNKETLLEIINNKNLSDKQKEQAVSQMIAMTKTAEQEAAVETMLLSKGFSEAVVTMTDKGVDVVVNSKELTDANRAQIEDIVTRKTGVAPENIVIVPMKE